jgi:hypothetical protein
MPNPSYYPLITSLGFTLAALGLVFSHPRLQIERIDLPILAVLGFIIMVVGVYGWSLEPAADPEPAAVEGGEAAH